MIQVNSYSFIHGNKNTYGMSEGGRCTIIYVCDNKGFLCQSAVTYPGENMEEMQRRSASYLLYSCLLLAEVLAQGET